MGFEIDEKSKMGSNINLLVCTKNDTFSIYYKVNIFFNYKTEEITNIIISQGFDKNSDGLIINLDVFIKEYINYFREAKLEELFKID